MDKFINNELNNTKTKEKNKEVGAFLQELESELGNELKDEIDMPLEKATISKSLYKEIYNDLPLAQKYRKQLKGIIRNCMLDNSAGSDYAYLSYDGKNKKYYADIYDGDVNRVYIPEKEFIDAKLSVDHFYDLTDDWSHFIDNNKDIRGYLKNQIEHELYILDLENKK